MMSEPAGRSRDPIRLLFLATGKAASETSLMFVVPVIDLLHGIVVRGVAGRRDEYQAVVSRLVDRPDPLSVARAFRAQFELDTLYVADLDAIIDGRINWDVYRELHGERFALWIDAGLRDVETARQVISSGAAAAVVGLETWPGPELLRELCRRLKPEQVIFSLDLQAGRPMGDLTEWQTSDAAEIACQAIDAGVRRMIVLDLTAVGVGAGVGTLDLCARLRDRHPRVQWITGGGVRNAMDLETLLKAGIYGVLMASALHDGRVIRSELHRVGLG